MNKYAGYAQPVPTGYRAMLRFCRDGKPEIVRQLLSYNPETGSLTWKPRPREAFATELSFRGWNSRYAGKEALNSSRDGYGIGTLLGCRVSAHRVCWLIHYGYWPENGIDHINGDRRDNRISNLRDVTDTENGRNQKTPVTNTSGVIGVYWYQQTGKWQARIRVSGHLKHLGYFEDFSDAVAARRSAERHYGFHENHGRAA